MIGGLSPKPSRVLVSLGTHLGDEVDAEAGAFLTLTPRRHGVAIQFQGFVTVW